MKELNKLSLKEQKKKFDKDLDELEERLQDVLALAAHWSYHASRACLALKFYTDSVRLCRDPLAGVRF